MSDIPEERRICLYTVGHSNHPVEDFLALLASAEIRSVVDVRSYPGSSRYVHYDGDALEATLLHRGITYHWFQKLGGWRKGLGEQSPNQGLHVEAARNYADYMLTDTFHTEIGRLQGIARIRTTAILCAEKDPGRCHRQYISDYLVVHGTDVYHILDANQCIPHTLTKHAVLNPDGKLVYPPHHQPGQDLLFET